MKLSEAKKAGFFTFDVDLSSHLNRESGSLIVKMGEPDLVDTQTLGNTPEEEAMKVYPEIMAKYIISHPFEDEAGGKVSNSEVVDFIMASASRAAYFIKEWTENLPLAKGSGEK